MVHISRAEKSYKENLIRVCPKIIIALKRVKYPWYNHTEKPQQSNFRS